MTTNYRELAIEFANKQASIKPMSAAEFAQCVREAEAELRKLDEPAVVAASDTPELVCDPKRAIKENSVTCAVCGESFKVITKSHLLSHGMTPEQYRELCGYAKGTPLIAKSLQRTRRAKMQDMKLWEKRKGGEEKPQADTPKTAAKPAPAKKEKEPTRLSDIMG